MPQDDPQKKPPAKPGVPERALDPKDLPKPGDDVLIEAVVKAQESLKKAEAALASYQDGVKLSDALSKIVEDYKAEYPDLEFDEDQLRDYRDNELAELSKILTPLGVAKIEAILNAAKEELRHIDRRIRDRREELADLRIRLETERKQAEAAKAVFEALKKPAASIKDRLKQAGAAKAEVDKSHRAGEYAVAYWLLTSPTKFKGHFEGKPDLVRPENLAAEVETARRKHAAAAVEAEALEVRIQAGEKALKADLDLHADRSKSREARIVQQLSLLKTPHPQQPQPMGSEPL